MTEKFATRSRLLSAAPVGFITGLVATATFCVMPRALANEPLLAANPFGGARGQLQPPPAAAPSQAVAPEIPPAAATATASPPAAKPKGDESVVLQQSSKPIVAGVANKWITSPDYISLKPSQTSMPLTLTVINGDGGPAFEDVRITLAGNVLGGIKDFKDGKLVKNLTNAVGAGNTRLVVQALGPVGAAITWKLTTLSISITSVTPDKMGGADKPVIKGKNFGPGARVVIGSKSCTVTAAKANELTIAVPDDLESGKQNLVVYVGSQASAPYKVTIKATPQVTGVDMLSAPPGQPIVVSGKNFSTTASENTVTIGGIGAPVTQATATSLTVTLPEMQFPVWNLPVVVKTNGVESKGKVTINVQQRVIPNDGTPEQ